jgi:hypothetical protein
VTSPLDTEPAPQPPQAEDSMQNNPQPYGLEARKNRAMTREMLSGGRP